MPANTLGADINEIAMGYFLAGEKWFSREAQMQFESRRKMVSTEEFTMQMGRAKAMAVEVMKYVQKHYKMPIVTNVFWTARPGSLALAVNDKTVDQKSNPSDIVIRLKSGDFLGISAKSSQSSPEIGFKNPGMGTIERVLKISFKAIVDHDTNAIVKHYKLPASNDARKAYVRSKPGIQAVTSAAGDQLLVKIRDLYLKKLKTMPQNELRKFILSEWLNSSKSLYPAYIKVTGVGKKIPFTAHVDDPLKNEKIENLRSSVITVVPRGDTGVGVMAGPKRVLAMRVKFTSEKMCSPIKFSGDPWH